MIIGNSHNSFDSAAIGLYWQCNSGFGINSFGSRADCTGRVILEIAGLDRDPLHKRLSRHSFAGRNPIYNLLHLGRNIDGGNQFQAGSLFRLDMAVDGPGNASLSSQKLLKPVLRSNINHG